MVKRVTKGLAAPWKKGQSGNPGGRPKGLSRLVRDKTDDGAAIYDRLWALAGAAKDERTQLEALKLIAAYGYGTPGAAQVEWDEDRVREAAKALGKDPDQAIVALRAIRGEKSA